jgi:hypothetical protein
MLSLIRDCGEIASTCGYCKAEEEGSHAHGMQVEIMSVETYQELLDRWVLSWRALLGLQV